MIIMAQIYLTPFTRSINWSIHLSHKCLSDMYTGEVVGGWNRFWSQVNSTHTAFTSCFPMCCFSQHTTRFYVSSAWLWCFPPSAPTAGMKAFYARRHAGLAANEADHVFRKSCAKDEGSLKPGELGGAAVRRVGNVAISWLNRNAGCYRTANNSLLCGLSVQLNMLVKLTNGISGCCSQVEQTANVSAKRSYSSAVFVRRKYRVWKEVSSSGIPAFFLSRNVRQLLTLLQHNICCAQSEPLMVAESLIDK